MQRWNLGNIVLALVLTAVGACAPPRAQLPRPVPAGTAPANPAAVPNLFDVQRQIAAYVDDGRYDADVAAVVREAEAWLEHRAKSATKPAIVLDVDETALSNWPAYRANGWARLVNGPCDLQHGPCGLRAWQESAQSHALAPTLALMRRARELRVAVFFITGRPTALRAATVQNLQREGYEWTDLVLPAKEVKYASAVDFKAPSRRMISEQGYTIILSMGDQQSDLDGGYAERTFKLPNPVYFLP